MDKNSFELLYKDAGKALGQNHLTDALTCIRGLLFNADSMELKNELESIRQDYGMMLAFMRQGGDDPQRDLIHRSLLNRASVLLDKSARNFRISTAHDIYTEALRRLGQVLVDAQSALLLAGKKVLNHCFSSSFFPFCPFKEKQAISSSS